MQSWEALPSVLLRPAGATSETFLVELHQKFLQTWLVNENSVAGRTFEEIWKIREECIAALAQS